MIVFSLLLTASKFLQAQESPQAEAFAVAKGFAVERVFSVDKSKYGSWVSMTVDHKGRLIACDERGKLHRVTLRADGGGDIETLKVDVGGAQGLLYAFDSLYVMGKGGGKSGLFRLQDTGGDDQYDKVEHFRQLPVGGDHHAHAIIPSPDGKSLYVCGGNMSRFPKPTFDSSRVPQVWKGDHIIPRMPDARGHNTGAHPIAGWIAKINPDGTGMELITTGFRNEYDIAFNPEGELFTYDSDMEYDIGSPWYRPTRVCHVISGGEFGWRYGTGKWPTYYADSLPGTVDIGPGSPTGIVFGTGLKYPAKYQRALFICDWSYGKIYATHLTPKGSTYTGELEQFVAAAPMPCTDLVAHPDGNIYFTTGGRGAQSGLYRIRYVGDESTEPAAPLKNEFADLQKIRRSLEALHVPGAKGAVEKALHYLGHEDRFIRFAARIAIENQPVEIWARPVLSSGNARSIIHGALALARHGGEEHRPAILEALGSLDWDSLSDADKLAALRAASVTFSRLGKPDEDMLSEIRDQISAAFPDSSPLVNRELCRLLAYLDDPALAAKAVKILSQSPTQEEQIHYAYCLRILKSGWTTDSRREYLEWFGKAMGHRGGASFQGFIKNIWKESVMNIPESELATLGDLASVEPVTSKKPADIEPREIVKNWTVDDLVEVVSAKKSGHDFARGRRMAAATGCFRCHRFDGEGGSVGPDLTSVGGRFGVREILESLIEPSKVISDQYQTTIFQLEDGRIVTGYVANMSGDNLSVAQNMLEPGRFTRVNVNQIEQQMPSPVSMMPENLISILHPEEIQDLIAYLRSGGKADHELFK